MMQRMGKWHSRQRDAEILPVGTIGWPPLSWDVFLGKQDVTIRSMQHTPVVHMALQGASLRGARATRMPLAPQRTEH